MGTHLGSWVKYWLGATIGTRTLAPFERTAPYIIRDIICTGAVTSSDVLVDIGCGDGRIAIGAAQQTGCRAFGIETDQSLCDLAKQNLNTAAAEDEKLAATNAAALPLRDRVTILRGDARTQFSAQLRTATIVTMYLSVSGNKRMKDTIHRAFDGRTGCRVVSYNFPIAGWRPNQTFTVPQTKQPIFLFNYPPQTE